MALAAEEQREQLEVVREIRSLMLEGEDAGHLVRDMQERIAVMFAAWASVMIASGRVEELHAALIRVLGEERARMAIASVAAPAVAPSAASTLDSTARSTAVSTSTSADPPAAKQVEIPVNEGKTEPRRDRLI